MFFGIGVSLTHSTPYIITGVLGRLCSWTAVDSSAKGLRPRPRSCGDWAGQNCFGQTALNWQQTSCIPGALESNKNVSLVRISTCHSNFVHQEMLEWLQSIGHSFNALAHAITHILDQDLPHNPQGESTTSCGSEGVQTGLDGFTSHWRKR